jgi:hypothetical protein
VWLAKPSAARQSSEPGRPAGSEKFIAIRQGDPYTQYTLPQDVPMTPEELLTIIAQARADEVTELNLSQQGLAAQWASGCKGGLGG